jgi:hypothetical protein
MAMLENIKAWCLRWLKADVVVGLGAVVVARLATVPRTLWEEDECRFVKGVLEYDPLHHYPHPPGYPLVIGLGKLLNLLLGNPFVALVVLAVVSTLVAYLALVVAFTHIVGSLYLPERAGEARRVAVIAALMLSLSPAMLVHGTLPMSDPPALAFAALALAALAAGRAGSAGEAVAAGVFAAAAIGCRPQLAVAVVPMLAVGIVQMREARRRWASTLGFAMTVLVWLVPLAVVVGGLDHLWRYELKQVRYVAVNDADLARGARSAWEIVSRFAFHPWGSKWLSLPIFALAIVGGVRLVRTRASRVLPVAVLWGAQLVFCIFASDPADGVRYSLPTLPLVALAATLGLAEIGRRLDLRLVPEACAGLLAAGSVLYALPVLRERWTPSPPTRALEYVAAKLPANAIVLTDPALRPHAELILGAANTMSIEDGMTLYGDQGEVPLYMLVDGGSSTIGALRFSWPDSDAYGKLTRNHYRTVSLIPIPASRRFLAGRGVFQWERTGDNEEWRWLAPVAELWLPHPLAARLRVTLRLPPSAPLESNTVTVMVNGDPEATVEVPRGRAAPVSVSLPPIDRICVTFVSTRSYVPAESGLGRDRRRLAVELIDLEQRPD